MALRDAVGSKTPILRRGNACFYVSELYGLVPITKLLLIRVIVTASSKIMDFEEVEE